MFMTPQACLEAGEGYPQYDLTVGFDVGKRFHVAFARGVGGSKALTMRVENLEACVDGFVQALFHLALDYTTGLSGYKPAHWHPSALVAR